MICAPTGFRWTVGAAISRPKAFSLLGRRCRAYARRMRVGAGMAKALQRAGQCPAPTKGEKRFYIRRRGGCPHPPALEGTPFVGHGLPDAPFRLPAKRRRGGTLGRPRMRRSAYPQNGVGAAHWAARRPQRRNPQRKENVTPSPARLRGSKYTGRRGCPEAAPGSAPPAPNPGRTGDWPAPAVPPRPRRRPR